MKNNEENMDQHEMKDEEEEHIEDNLVLKTGMPVNMLVDTSRNR